MRWKPAGVGAASEKDYCGTRDCETVNASEHIRLTTEAVVSLTARKRIFVIRV